MHVLTTSRRALTGGTLLVLLITALVASGCSLFQGSSANLEGPPKYIPYGEVDLRHFAQVGYSIRTDAGYEVTVEASKQDTLVWFEQLENGQFMHAFLRRDNMVYLLEPTGGYKESMPWQTAMYSLFMDTWREVQPESTKLASK
ncbi:MAG TPA: hypothetical protein VKP65_16690 [Rhodothermales bacterium]|nr:hypothetical protein [Rhodothermales bacterium]